MHVTLLRASDLAGGDLHGYDAILVGIRAYAVRPDLVTDNERLLDYVKNGGVMIVQYNTPEFDHNFGPYRYKMGEEPEEVTDEASKVNILDRQTRCCCGRTKSLKRISAAGLKSVDPSS